MRGSSQEPNSASRCRFHGRPPSAVPLLPRWRKALQGSGCSHGFTADCPQLPASAVLPHQPARLGSIDVDPGPSAAFCGPIRVSRCSLPDQVSLARLPMWDFIWFTLNTVEPRLVPAPYWVVHPWLPRTYPGEHCRTSFDDRVLRGTRPPGGKPLEWQPPPVSGPAASNLFWALCFGVIPQRRKNPPHQFPNSLLLIASPASCWIRLAPCFFHDTEFMLMQRPLPVSRQPCTGASRSVTGRFDLRWPRVRLLRAIPTMGRLTSAGSWRSVSTISILSERFHWRRGLHVSACCCESGGICMVTLQLPKP
jgi:hypothetical protein